MITVGRQAHHSLIIYFTIRPLRISIITSNSLCYSGTINESKENCRMIFSCFSAIKNIFVPSSSANFSTKLFFFYQGFLHRHWWFTGQQGKGEDHLFYSAPPPLPTHEHWDIYQKFVRWLWLIFNRNACVYQTATRWDLPPYRTVIWVIDWWRNFCLLTWWINIRFLIQRFDIWNRRFWTRIDYNPCITSEPRNIHICLSW